MTETASHVALRNISQGHEYFKPQMGVTLFTDETDRIIIEIHELGLELKTEDIGLISFFGFKVLGRADQIINSGGIKIHPGAIELKIGPLLKQAGINRSFYITKMKDEKLGDAMLLVIEGSKIKDENFLLEMLKREVPKHHAPREIKYESQFERTDTGKLIRKTY
jgi:O-succinylbenzoic acid--CoA ligase